MWKLVSSSRLHIGHWTSSITFLLHGFAFVGKTSLQALPIKFLSALGICSFHRELHISLGFSCVELLAICYTSIDLARWYALFTVNSPFLVPLHIITSHLFVQLNGIDKIAITLWGRNSALIKSLFYHFVSLSISAQTFAFGARSRGGDWIE